ncbi:MAG: branched-chain amino acid transporter permease, partial [Ramlibacter sp.]|nr:branched-chain amino acid transporter permease [Ramlibacter sp.]
MTRARIATVAALLAALILPWALQAADADFYLGTASRIIVYAVAATSLNLLLGYGGMISLGHAAFFGLGAYSTAILLSEGVRSAPIHLLAVLAVVGVAALVIGVISLRTRGVYFIMIT